MEWWKHKMKTCWDCWWGKNWILTHEKTKYTGNLHCNNSFTSCFFKYLSIIGNGFKWYLYFELSWLNCLLISFSNSLFSCKIVNMIGCWLNYVFISKYSLLVFTLLLVCVLYVDCFLILWFPFERKGSSCYAAVFFISESSYWSSTTDAYSHTDTLTIHPLQSATY